MPRIALNEIYPCAACTRFYYGEITLYHGAGYNSFYPPEYGDRYAKMLEV